MPHRKVLLLLFRCLATRERTCYQFPSFLMNPDEQNKAITIMMYTICMYNNVELGNLNMGVCEY